MTTDWADALEPAAPDIVAAWRGIEEGQFISVRREVRRRAGAGSAGGLVVQLAGLAGTLRAIVESLPDRAFAMRGGEEDWTVAEAVGHTAASRAGLALAAGLAASGRWPADAPIVTPGVPGPAGATRDELLGRLERSQKVIARAAVQVAGHEEEACPLVHPLVGRLRCGEWLLFAGVHDLMHLEQLHRIVGRLDAREAAVP